MLIVDTHCDTITKIMEVNGDLYKNDCHIDIERLKELGSCVQFFAAFIEPRYYQANAIKRAVQIIDKFYEQIETYSNSIMFCRNYNDIQTTAAQGKISALLSIEGGEALQGDLAALRMLYRLGVRSICLTWNHRNEIADGVGEEITGGGLTLFGRNVVMEMNKLGMLIDISHISEKGFWDVVELSEAPVIASHSNAKKICNHPRNLTDEQMLALKKKGGVVGVNLYPPFLNDSGRASLKDVLLHIEHIFSVIGTDFIGLGADFDGIEYTPADLRGVKDLRLIFDEMLKLNYSEETVRKFAGENFLRVIKEVLK